MTLQNRTTPLVTVHLWGVPSAAIPRAIARMATQRAALRRTRGIRFCKLIGTGSQTFRLRDADPHHWGIVAAWDDEADARVFELGSVVTAWDRTANEKARFLLRPISTRGEWSRTRPFEPVEAVLGGVPSGPIAAITRARIRPRRLRTFAKAAPAVAAAATGAAGLRLATGIGESPVALQGTFTVWEDNRSLLDFVGGQAHARVIGDTDRVGWYTEELFARFAILQAQGTFRGLAVEANEGL